MAQAPITKSELFMTKKMLITLFILKSISAFACITEGDVTMCVGDIVFKGASTGATGAKVLAINKAAKMATIQTLSGGALLRVTPKEIDVTKGCVENICVGDSVYNNTYSFAVEGMKVVAINNTDKTVIVHAVTAYIYRLSVDNLAIARGCLEGVCVGDKVFKGADYTAVGATVMAINYTSKMLINSVEKSTSTTTPTPASTVDIQKENSEYGEEMRAKDYYIPANKETSSTSSSKK
jgi:hypothetical protein